MLRFRTKFTPRLPVELDGLSPDVLRDHPLASIESRMAIIGHEQIPWGELFFVSGNSSTTEIKIEGDLRSFKNIGKGMRSGRLHVVGDVGMNAGSHMHGGELMIDGSAEDWLGAEMRGGIIRVTGSARNLVGAAYRGAAKGMRGGSIFIEGDAGDETGAYMRRGLIAVQGNCGRFAGNGMIAGTIVIGGKSGENAGAGMKRGTIVSFSGEIQPPSTFRHDCIDLPPIWKMLIGHLRKTGFKTPEGIENKPIHRLRGDFLTVGKGEILISSSMNT